MQGVTLKLLLPESGIVYLQAPAKRVWNLLHLMHIVSHTAAYVSSCRFSEAG